MADCYSVQGLGYERKMVENGLEDKDGLNAGWRARFQVREDFVEDF